MTREEYVEKMKKDDDWAPGWDAIDREFDRCIPDKSLLITVQISTQERFSEAIIILTDILFMNLRKAISI